MSRKDWKDHLLSSGLPLEYSVIEILKKAGVEEAGEFRYERPNELGIPTIFSVDVHARHNSPVKTDLQLDIFIECKYRHDATQWVFLPDQYNRAFGRWFQDVFISLDQLTGDRVIDRDDIGRFANQYKLCGKGIEIYQKDTNPKSIEQAIHQLRFGVVERAVELISRQSNALPDAASIYTLVPFIVTTAELWQMQPGLTMEKMRDATELSEVAETHDVLVINQRPNDQMIRYTFSRLDQSLTPEQKVKIDGELSGKKPFNSYLQYARHCSTDFPSLFVVINYTYFADTMRNLLTIFDKPRLITKRDTY